MDNINNAIVRAVNNGIYAFFINACRAPYPVAKQFIMTP